MENLFCNWCFQADVCVEFSTEWAGEQIYFKTQMDCTVYNQKPRKCYESYSILFHCAQSNRKYFYFLRHNFSNMEEAKQTFPIFKELVSYIVNVQNITVFYPYWHAVGLTTVKYRKQRMYMAKN